MFVIPPLILPARPIRATQIAARTEFRSSYFQNTPPGFEPGTTTLPARRTKIILYYWWAWMDLNHRPPLYKSGALTAELHART